MSHQLFLTTLLENMIFFAKTRYWKNKMTIFRLILPFLFSLQSDCREDILELSLTRKKAFKIRKALCNMRTCARCYVFSQFRESLKNRGSNFQKIFSSFRTFVTYIFNFCSKAPIKKRWWRRGAKWFWISETAAILLMQRTQKTYERQIIYKNTLWWI